MTWDDELDDGVRTLVSLTNPVGSDTDKVFGGSIPKLYEPISFR